MTANPTCPRCGRMLPEDAPRGLCPACLLAAAMGGPGDATDETSGPSSEEPGDAAGPSTTVGQSERLPETATSDAQGLDAPLAPGSAVRYFGDYEVQAELGRG